MTDDLDSSRAYVTATTLGVVAGMRTQLPLALLALAAREGTFAAQAGAPLNVLRAPAALPLLAASAVGEIVVDKLPFTPSRLASGPLLGRLACGGIAGAAVAREAGFPARRGAAIGAAGAGIGALAGYPRGATLGRASGVPDPRLGRRRGWHRACRRRAIHRLVARGRSRSPPPGLTGGWRFTFRQHAWLPICADSRTSAACANPCARRRLFPIC